MIQKSLIASLFSVLLLVAPAFGQDAGKEKAKVKKVTAQLVQPAKVIVPSFDNAKCPMSGRDINPESFVEKGGERVFFCCDTCAGKGKADPEKWITTAYKDVKKLENKVCPISDHEIDAKKATLVSYQGNQVSLCCADCEKAFKADPKLVVTQAMYPKAKDLANAKCPGSGQKVTPGKIAIFQNQIVHFCCDDCVAGFEKSPKKMMAKVTKKDGK